MSKVKNRKNMIIGISIAAVLVIAAIVVLFVFLNRNIAGGSDVAYGEPHDYEADGFITLGEYKGINMSVEVTDEDVQEEIASDYLRMRRIMSSFRERQRPEIM